MKYTYMNKAAATAVAARLNREVNRTCHYVATTIEPELLDPQSAGYKSRKRWGWAILDSWSAVYLILESHGKFSIATRDVNKDDGSIKLNPLFNGKVFNNKKWYRYRTILGDCRAALNMVS